MPPKKTATKVKATKNEKTAPKEEDQSEEVKVTNKNRRAAPKKREVLHEEEPDEDVPQTKKAPKEKSVKNGKAAPKEIEVVKDDQKDQKKKPAASKSKAKVDPPAENENEGPTEKVASKATKRQTAKSGKSEEVPETSKSKSKGKPTAGKKAKRDESPEESEGEEDAAEPPAKKSRKRKPTKDEEKEPEPTKKAKAPANATATDWASVSFACTSETPKGETSNFHITSWNVDGLRAWVKKGGLEMLQHDQPDVLCLQETKCDIEKLPAELVDIEGYEAYWCTSEKDGYAGVGLLTKSEPLNVTYGIGEEEHNKEGRCITAEFESFYVVNVYVPNAGRKLVTLPKRLEWNRAFKAFIKELDNKKPVIVCGDMNVARSEIDLANPKANVKNAGFTIEEREGMTDFLEDGYVDTFRELYPDKEKAYTFWTYMANARARNIGWRLDYFIVSERFKENVCDSVILDQVLGSDHCPITLFIKI